MFRLVIISPPSVSLSDIPFINSLLTENIFFHIRIKSEKSLSTKQILDAIDETHQNKIIVHQDFQLAESKNIYGIHLSEELRNKPDFSGKLRLVSTSVHALSDYQKLDARYEYVFYSPVFASISKPGHYPRKNFDEIKDELEYITNRQRLIALGGITAENIRQVKEAGFGGAAFIGAVWSAQDPLKAYSDLESAARGVVR